MQVNKLPSYTTGVRHTAATAFEERHPHIRFFTAPEGGAGGDNGGAGAGAGGAGGSGDPDGGGEDQLGEAGKKALVDERTARKAAEARVKELEDGKLTADQKLQRDADESKTKVGQLESDNGKLALENGRLRAALTEGLPVDWADRVRGETDEEMLADAKKIKASLRDSGAGDTTEGAGARGADAPVETSPGLGTLRAGYEEISRKK
jgi:regulator of replication initiation timing